MVWLYYAVNEEVVILKFLNEFLVLELGDTDSRTEAFPELQLVRVRVILLDPVVSADNSDTLILEEVSANLADPGELAG